MSEREKVYFIHLKDTYGDFPDIYGLETHIHNPYLFWNVHALRWRCVAAYTKPPKWYLIEVALRKMTGEYKDLPKAWHTPHIWYVKPKGARNPSKKYKVPE